MICFNLIMKKRISMRLNNISLIDPNMAKIFVPWAIRHPRYLISFNRLLKSYKISVEVRKKLEKDDFKVPPFMILSITKQCNLKCAGCYATATGTLNNEKICQLKKAEWHRIVKEADDLGVFAFIIAGGEPFLFPGLLDFCKEFKEKLFIIFTNGTAIKEEDFAKLKKLTNTAVIVSIEGDREQTDQRRGQGVYEKALTTINRLNKIGIINGISVTINRLNYRFWTNPEQIDSLIKKGVRLGFFMEFIPSTPELKSIIALTSPQRKEFRAKILEYRERKKIYIIHSPGDEELIGGCVSAGRGFVHVTPSGDLTPCPVSNIATHNLKFSTLKESLASPLFKMIRENEYLLETEGVPCALFAHQKEVEMLAKSVGGYIIN